MNPSDHTQSMHIGTKRVLLMASSMRGGGSERQVLMLAKSIDRARFEPHLYLTEAAGDFLGQIPSDVPVHSFDTDLHPRSSFYVPGRQLRRQTEFLRTVIREQRIDVIYDRTFHMTLIAGNAAGDVPRVSTIVSPPHLALPLVEKRFVVLKRRRLSSAYRRSKVVIAVSREAALSAESYYGLAPGSVEVIKNPVDAVALGNAAGTRHHHAKRHHAAERTTFVVVGRMTPEKGHADLIESLPMIRERWPATRPPWQFRLVGDGPLRGELESHVAAMGLSDHVCFVGALENAAIEIASADALVLPSRFEGMPNVVLEAMALGTPVIATRAGGTIELQHDAPTAFWAHPADPPTLATAIINFACDPDAARLHRDAALRLVAADHDPKTIIRQIEDRLAR